MRHIGAAHPPRTRNKTMSTASEPDPYQVLGVPRNATAPEIRSAYRALLRATHPDTRNCTAAGDSDAALARVLKAYAVLRDPDRRAAYDLEHPSRQRPAWCVGASTQIPIRAGPVRWTPA